MECYYHPDREGTDRCAICGKAVCKECCLEIAGKTYCKECLEKIVGLEVANSQPKQEPVRLEKQEAPSRYPEENIDDIFSRESVNKPQNPIPTNEPQYTPQNPIPTNEPQYTPQNPIPTNEPQQHKISDDSPYNIKHNINYDNSLDSSYDNYQPPEVQQSLNEAINEINKKEPEVQHENIQRNVQYEPKPTPQIAQNEFDITPQRPIARPQEDDYIYPDHSYQPPQTSASRDLEDKYARYLDDLYFDEEIPLEQQLAKDEEKYGSLTKTPRPVQQDYYEPPVSTYRESPEDELDRRIREELAREQARKNGRSIHGIKYQEEKEPYGAVDIILTIILIIVILIVLYYVIYLFFLSSAYPTFTDALFGLTNPGNVISNLLNN